MLTRITLFRGSIGRALSRLAHHPAGPTALAVAIALISLPFVAVNLQLYELESSGFAISDIHPLAPTDPARWTAAASAVLLSALIAGSAGGWLLRHRSGYSYWIALLWPGSAASAALPCCPRSLVSISGPSPCVSTGAATESLQVHQARPSSRPLCSAGSARSTRVRRLDLVVGFVAWSQILRSFGPPAPPPSLPRWGSAQQESQLLPAPYPWPYPVGPTAPMVPSSGAVPAPAKPPTQPADNGDDKAG